MSLFSPLSHMPVEHICVYLHDFHHYLFPKKHTGQILEEGGGWKGDPGQVNDSTTTCHLPP